MTLRNYSSTAAETTLSAGISAANTAIQVAATTGFPAAPFILALDAGASAQELVLVTNVAGLTLTVTRGYDSTVAVAHDVGAVVQHSHAAIEFREANTHVNASDGVHGVTGDLVGNSDAQTLTNKTLALGSNTVTGTKAQFNTALTDADFATLDGTETLTNKTVALGSNTVTGTKAQFNTALTDGDFLFASDLSLSAWTSYVPVLSGFTVSSSEAYYKQVGKTVHVSYAATLNSAVSTTMSVSLPVAAARAPAQRLAIGTIHALDSGTARHNGVVCLASSATVIEFWSDNVVNAWTATAPFIWASGDQIGFTITYEAV